MDLHANIKTITEQVEALKQSLSDKIVSLPDNPRIHRLSPSAFVVSSSDLGNNWTPEHHDFKWQYKAITDKVMAMDVQRVPDFLWSLAMKGRLKISDNYRVTLHQDVRVHLVVLLLT